MNLYPWQKEALEKENDKALWCAEAGTGKTHAANLWIEQKDRATNPVILCPKQIKQKWQSMKPQATVFTPYDARTKELPANPSCIVVDEADAFASPLFFPAKQRSQCAAALYQYIKENPDTPVLLLTATPIRSKAWNLHTLLTYIGRYIDWKEFRQEHFLLDTPRWSTRPTWMPKFGWQAKMQPLLEEHAEIALMKDMTELPPETHEVIKLKEPNYEKHSEEWEAAKIFSEDHQLEQHKKHLEIEKISRGYRKAVIVCQYRTQIDELSKELSKSRQTLVLDGRTKDVQQVIDDAEASAECYLIVQASVGAGFELPSFAVMIFASQSYGVRNFVQMKARIKRINALKPLKYYYLQAGRCDKAVYKTVESGRDFVPSEYRA